jgi:hypothetical protein
MQPPGYPAQPPAAANDKVTLWGVLGIVLGFCCWPVGLIFAILGLQEAKKFNKPPTLAYVGFGVVALNLLWTIFAISTGFYSNLTN